MSDGASPYTYWFDMWRGAMSLWAPRSADREGDDAETEWCRMVGRMTDAHLATVDSGVRYVSGCAAITGRGHTAAVRAWEAAYSRSAERRKEVDALTKQWREACQDWQRLPLDEYKRLQDELAAIWRSTPTADGVAAGDDAAATEALG